VLQDVRTRTDRRGGVWGFAYDFAGKLAADTMPTVTAAGQQVRPTVRFSSLERTVLVAPASGQGTSANPAPRVDPATARATVTTPGGSVTRYQLDRWRAATRIEEPYGRVSLVTRDDSGRVRRTVSAAGDTVDFTWVKANLTQTTNRATGATVTMTYEPTYNQLATVSGHASPVWNYWSSGRLDSTRAGASTRKVTKSHYDNRGRDTLVDEPAGADGEPHLRLPRQSAEPDR
jgi:hypothetical protein